MSVSYALKKHRCTHGHLESVSCVSALTGSTDAWHRQYRWPEVPVPDRKYRWIPGVPVALPVVPVNAYFSLIRLTADSNGYFWPVVPVSDTGSTDDSLCVAVYRYEVYILPLFFSKGTPTSFFDQTFPGKELQTHWLTYSLSPFLQTQSFFKIWEGKWD